MNSTELQNLFTLPWVHALLVASAYTLAFMSLDKLFVPLILKYVVTKSTLHYSSLKSFFVRLFMLMVLVTLTIIEHAAALPEALHKPENFMTTLGIMSLIIILMILGFIELMIFQSIRMDEEKYNPQAFTKTKGFFYTKNFRYYYETAAYSAKSKTANLILYILSFIHLVIFIN